MNTIECLLLILITGTLNVVSFLVGAGVRQKVDKGEPIELPKVNPMEVVRRREDRRIAEKEQNKVDVILQNIESYNGTSQGQKDVPR